MMKEDEMMEKLEKDKLYEFTDKIVDCLQHKNAVKQVYELQRVIQEIWNHGNNQNKINEA